MRLRRTGSWAGKSQPAKVEIYTRWSFHSFIAIEIGLVGLPAVSLFGSPIGGWFMLLLSVHAIVSAVSTSYALSWALGRRERPVRPMVATAVITAVGCLAVTRMLPSAEPSLKDAEALSYLLVTFAGFGIGSLVVGLRRVRSMLLTVLAAMVFVGLAGLVFGLSFGAIFGAVLGVLIAGLSLAFACGFSVWLVRSVWELDHARELQTRLAVAEERLRFGRDMHDVMGRNLAVIAFKSELAVQLARRGGTERAAEQMAEVQRIAQESQREVRAVVRGYREVDLHTELEGARGVLKAAGIRFRLDREGTAGSGAPPGAAGAAEGLTPGVQSALGWVVREAATNVLRHGDARQCTVRLTVREGSEVVLVVENDGVPDEEAPVRAGAGGDSRAGAAGGVGGAGAADVAGTPADGGPAGHAGRAGGVAVGGTAATAPAPRTPGAGLAGLRERLATVDGTLDAGRVAGGRFRLTARVPLPAPSGASARVGGPATSPATSPATGPAAGSVANEVSA
ncbi:histidine kinase [Streptomyces sp. NBC_01498]|uniref:sensor histidine kinase n=1 Tax=Streptomyces sp. NBC_01498 TaxID=2975870 RepID=UPI002E7B0FC5|nr:histidine kinase [Streptomyces sp. NBC_01498]WTL26016.1 histidine kinase [Streptomyces sp. NBC_01498]